MRSLLYVGALCIALAIPAIGQTFGEITGLVRDQSGAALVNAQVTVVNAETNATRTTESNEAGAFAFPALPPGTYNVRVEKQGFRAAVQNGVLLQVQQSARLDFDLSVGQVSESVEVSANAQLLTTENATVGTVIENKRIVELPLNGRNYLQLVSLLAKCQLRLRQCRTGGLAARRRAREPEHLGCRAAELLQ